MPGIGKSGNCRRAARRLIFVRASSVVLVGAAVDWDSSLVALSGSAMVEAVGRATGVCCVVIVEKKGRERGEVRCIGSQICKW